ncbi:MAG: hypothetical protein NC548_24450 [Lachnospiraceae bacterium]|nr:hypothetical protein [Lachnospiraceae bacterium]
MITLSFTSQTPIDFGTIPEQWRDSVTQRTMQLIGSSVRTYLVIIQVQPDDSSYRYRALMQKPQLVLKFSLPFYFEFPVGTSCTYENQRFFLTRTQDLKKQGTRKIEYTMTLGTTENYFSDWKLRNIIDPVESGEDAPRDNRLKFSMCAKPHEFIDLIVRNLNSKDTSVTWSRGECIESSEKTVEFNHAYIDTALTDIANTFETEYEVEYIGTTQAKLHLHRVEYNKSVKDAVRLSYGVGNGFIPGVGRTSEADGVPVKRIFTQGTDRNIDRSKYGAPELLMPKSQTIRYDGTHFEGEDGYDTTIARTYKTDENGESVERTDKVSQATREDSLDCTEIYPSRIGVVSEVAVANAEKNFYDIIDKTIPEELNFNSCLIAGETMTIIFQDGMLAGKEFDVKYKHEERKFEIVPQEIDGVMMPNATFCPKEKQTYAVFGIQLPDAYICNNSDKSGASWDMMRAAVKSLYEAEDQRFTFSGQLQALWAKRHWNDVGGMLVVGGHVLFRDEQFAKDGVLIRITGIKDYLTAPYSPTIELSNGVSASTSVSTQIRQITNTEVVIEDTRKEMMQYTKRRFRDALETLGMLDDAQLDNFSGSVSPVAVQTMALLAGDESLQFRFVYKSEVTNEDGTKTVNYYPTTPIGYNNDKKQLFATMNSAGMDVCLQHMTLGQNAIMTQTRRDADGYLVWPMKTYTSPVLTEPKQSYYLYAKVSSTSTEEAGEFVLSEKAIAMEAVNGYFHLLCGVLNSEIEGSRSYVSLYGFTEILPGRITTDLIISNDGKTYFDLEKGEIGGALKFLSDSGYITIIEGGKIKTELIDVSQIIAKSVIVGEVDKQRVEIQPDSEGNGSVKIFDSNNNECTVLEGNSYSDIKDLYDGTTGADCEILSRTKTELGFSSGVSLGRGTLTVNANSTEESVSSNETKTLSKVWHTATPTEIEIKQGKLYASAYSAGYTTTSGSTTQLQPMIMSHASASVTITVRTYSEYNETTGVLSKQVHSATLAYASASASASASTYYDDFNNGLIDDNNHNTGINRPITTIGGSTSTTRYDAKYDNSGVVNIAGKKVRVPAGYHVLEIRVYCNAQHSGSNASVNWGNAGKTDTDVMAKWLSDFYVSRFFANGFCLGTRSDDYILAYRTTDGGMRFVMESNDIGFDFSKAGIRTRAKGKNWMPLPMLIYKASYYYLSTNNTYPLKTTHGYKTFNGSTLEATRTGKGLVTLTFPDSWKTDLQSIGVENLLVHVNAHHQVIDARVESITTYAIKVAMSDDASLNDGDFGIVIYYLAS